MQHLGLDIDRFARRHGLRRGVEAAAIVSAAREVLPSVLPTTLASEVEVAWFREGTLGLAITSSAARALVMQYRNPLLVALKKRIGRSYVERIVLHAERSLDR